MQIGKCYVLDQLLFRHTPNKKFTLPKILRLAWHTISRQSNVIWKLDTQGSEVAVKARLYPAPRPNLRGQARHIQSLGIPGCVLLCSSCVLAVFWLCSDSGELRCQSETAERFINSVISRRSQRGTVRG